MSDDTRASGDASPGSFEPFLATPGSFEPFQATPGSFEPFQATPSDVPDAGGSLDGGGSPATGGSFDE